MRSSPLLLPGLFATLTLSACSLILDGSAHRGGQTADGGTPSDAAIGDAGAPDAGCDRDRDTYLSLACGGDDCDDDDPNVFPNAPPICGNGALEGCPGDSSVPVAFFGGASAGRLTPVVAASGASGYGDLALATTPQGGGGLGTGVLLLLQGPTADALNPLRLDLPLDDLEEASAVPLPSSGGGDLTTQTFTSVALEHVVDGVVVAVLQGDPLSYEGRFDLVAGDPGLGSRGFDGSWGEAAIFDGSSVFRSMGGTAPAIYGSRLQPPPSLFLHEGPDVPSGEVHTVASAGVVALRPTEGEILFWRGFEAPLGRITPERQTGRLAVETLANGDDLIALAFGDRVEINPLDCANPDNECVMPVVIGTPNVVRTGAQSAEVLGARTLSDSSSVVLILEHDANGDRLTLQPVGANLLGLPYPRIELLDLSEAGERVQHAALDLRQTPTGTTALVAATVGSEATLGSRVVLTGVRACETD